MVRSTEDSPLVCAHTLKMAMWHETGHRAEVTSKSVVATFNGHKRAVTALAFDDAGARLASGSQDTDLILWDVIGEAGLFRFVILVPGCVQELN